MEAALVVIIAAASASFCASLGVFIIKHAYRARREYGHFPVNPYGFVAVEFLLAIGCLVAAARYFLR